MREMEGDFRVELIEPRQSDVFRDMTTDQRLATALSWTTFLRRRIEAHVSERHPDWTRTEVRGELARRWRHGSR